MRRKTEWNFERKRAGEFCFYCFWMRSLPKLGKKKTCAYSVIGYRFLLALLSLLSLLSLSLPRSHATCSARKNFAKENCCFSWGWQRRRRRPPFSFSLFFFVMWLWVGGRHIVSGVAKHRRGWWWWWCSFVAAVAAGIQQFGITVLLSLWRSLSLFLFLFSLSLVM